MMNEHDCEGFQELLDALEGTYPSGAELEELERRAAGCRDCETLLGAYTHLAGPPAGELEAEVPDGLVDSMWTRVSSRTVERPLRRRRCAPGRILIPTLAAAVVLLVFALGFMLGELRHLRGTEERMAAMIERREETIAALQARRSDGAPELFASERFRDFAFRKLLQRRDAYRVGDLISYLERLPSNTKVLSAREVEALLNRRSMAVYSPYTARLRTVDYTNGLDAGEAILLIEALGIDADEMIPREQIANLRGI